MSDISTGLANGAGSRGHERADDEKTTLDQAERWATLLGAQLSSMQPKTLASEPTSAWHSGAGDMTPSNATSGTSSGACAAAPTGTAQAADTGENRMIVRVDGGDLGEVALVIDRKEGAIRVTISAADAGAEGTTMAVSGATELAAAVGAVVPLWGLLVAVWRGEQPVVSATRTVTPTTARPA